MCKSCDKILCNDALNTFTQLNILKLTFLQNKNDLIINNIKHEQNRGSNNHNHSKHSDKYRGLLYLLL